MSGPASPAMNRTVTFATLEKFLAAFNWKIIEK
jgi:hypothetical protein